MSTIMLLFLFQLSDAENSYQKLLKNKTALEQDIEIKAISLLIDKEECLGNRKNFHRACFNAKMLLA